MKALIIRITGDVQGVSYRYHARSEAAKLGLAGWARNENDGTVSILVQGEEPKVDEYVEWTREGSPMATVEEVEVTDTEVDERLKGFEIK